MFALFCVKALAALFLLGPAHAVPAGYETVGSSGVAAQMLFLAPNTSKVIFIDNYHQNRGQKGVDLNTGAHAPEDYVYPSTTEAVFSTEFDTSPPYGLRPLRPIDNTFCSAGAFFPNGTLLNIAGAEGYLKGDVGINEGFGSLRSYAPGLCANDTLTDGSALVVGGSNWGGLMVNEWDINVPSYEIVPLGNAEPAAPVPLPMLEFTAEQNKVPDRSYNLFPHLYLLPNGANKHILTTAGNQTVIWDYSNNALVATFADTPLQPRAFPSVATSVLLPLRGPAYGPAVLLCGGSSKDIPNPIALNDCHTIQPLAQTPTWNRIDDMPSGAQTISDGILLPDGAVLLLNGAHTGSSGAGMAEDPVLTPLIYNHSAPIGFRFTSMPETTIPRLYHSTASLLPSGQVIVAGGNPSVGYDPIGQTSANPEFINGKHSQICFLCTQQSVNSCYPTEYRVEIFSPPYMEAAANRPAIAQQSDIHLTYGRPFTLQAGTIKAGDAVEIVLSATGFHSHGLATGQRMVVMESAQTGMSNDGSRVASYSVQTFDAPSIMPPGMYLLIVVVNGIPSEGKWVGLAAA